MNDRDLTSAHILVVEDDDLQQEVLRSSLTWHGYRTEAVSSGLDAVCKVRHGGYDLLLIDYHLPDIDGLATARLVRDLRGTAARPVLIALTGAPDQLLALQAQHGEPFDRVIAKPTSLSDLISSIQRELGSMRDRAAPWETDLPEQNIELLEPLDPGKPRILVVEDDDIQQFVLQHALERLGYEVGLASDGVAAVRMARAREYDLVMIDYLLPDIDGLATAKLILDPLDEDHRPRMIAMTAAPSRLSGREAETGPVFDEVVAKSPDLPALITVVKRHLAAPSARPC